MSNKEVSYWYSGFECRGEIDKDGKVSLEVEEEHAFYPLGHRSKKHLPSEHYIDYKCLAMEGE